MAPCAVHTQAHFLYSLIPSPSVTKVALNRYNMINTTQTTTQRNSYHMARQTHVPRCPCFNSDRDGDKDVDNNNATDLRGTHGRPLYSNFRKYATPPDEKRCRITEKSFLCSLGIFFGACLA